MDCELPDGDIDGDECFTPVDPQKSDADTNAPKNQPGQCSGNPIDNTTGNKYEDELDYAGSGPFPLVLNRHYNSKISSTSPFGANWNHGFSGYIQVISTASVQVVKSDNKRLAFSLTNGVWKPSGDVLAKLAQLTDYQGKTTGWLYTTSDEIVETYDGLGRLVSVANRAGLKQTLAYDAAGRLASVADPFGRKLSFTYDIYNRIKAVTDPAGGGYTYTYDANNNLSSATYPDGKTRTYLYENKTFPHALTGLVDENGVRFATWTYDSSGLAITSEHGSGIDKVTLTYDAAYGTSTVTDALGRKWIYDYYTAFGSARTMAARKPTSASSGWEYDANGNVSAYTDYNGNRTTYAYDLTRNLEISRTLPNGITITTAWHPNFRLPAKITEPNRVTTFTYDTLGNLLQKTITAGTQARTWIYTYNASGQILTLDGPRTDVNDITRFSYDSQGNLASLTNALGQVSAFTRYDANGRLLSMTDPNGLVTNLSYDQRGRLLARTVGGETTAYAYDGAGNLIKTTLPDGSSLSFGYDAAHRLTGVVDSLGNHIDYTLDAMGNRTKVDTFDPTNKLVQTHSSVFNALDLVAQDIGAKKQTTAYGYDNNDNLTAITDPLTNQSTRSFDSLDRLLKATDPLGGSTSYAYDSNSRLSSVADPRSAKTSYTYDGLDNLTKLQSPDTGITTYTYDAAGNRISATDARGKLTTYAYDALNRLIQTQYADGKQTLYRYDQGTNGIGRLSSLTDASGSTSWIYDAHGRVVQKQQIIGFTALTVSYIYDLKGRLVATTYPSGRQIAYAYNAAGQVSAITVDGQTLLNKVGYRPFGPVASWAWGNAAAYSRTFDLDGRLASFPLGQDTRSLTYDAAGRITAVNDKTGSQNLDPVLLRDSGKTNYGLNGNRLSSRTGLSPLNYSYDADGNLLGDGFNVYTYDAKNRLAQVVSGGSVTGYSINGLGQRVAKTGSSVINGGNYFAYDEAGQLLGEYAANGNPVQETIWFAGVPVGVVKPKSGLFYVFADQLGTPRVVTTPSQKTVWRWVSDPFGNGYPTEGTDDLGVKFSYNLRFPGQYYDAETMLHYNYFRDYDPTIGRYVQSDPIGLEGSINTYAYVNGSPLIHIDPLGLWTVNIGISGSINIPLIGPVGIGGGGFGGIAYDGTNWAWYGGGGGGIGAGAGGSLGIQIGGSNAKTVCDLQGPFGSLSASGGEGLIVGGEGYTGSGSQGQSVTGGNLFIGGGGGTPVSGTAGVTYTWVKPW